MTATHDDTEQLEALTKPARKRINWESPEIASRLGRDPDAAIAADVGVSTTAVRQARAARNIPPPLIDGKLPAGTRTLATLKGPLTPAEIAAGKADALDPVDDSGRPKTRGDCASGPRPCPWASCRYHLAVEARSKSVVLAHGHDDVTQLAETCALDVADRGPATLDKVGAALSVTRERVRQIEGLALAQMRQRMNGARLDWFGEAEEEGVDDGDPEV